MKKPEGKVPAGWYDDYEDSDAYTFWNGKYWSTHKIRKGTDSPENIPHPVRKTFVESIKHTVMSTFKYSGRAGRREYWLFQAALFGSLLLASIVLEDSGLEILIGVIFYGFLPTQISLYVRRCHDTNRRGWWYFVPFGNFIILFFDSDSFENRFGEPVF